MLNKFILKALTAVLTLCAVSLIFSAISFAGTTTYVYDEMDRLSEVRLGNGNAIAYEYDKTGNLRAKKPTGPNVVTITSSASAGGNIYPLGPVPMFIGSRTEFTIVPAAGNRIGDILVDNIRIDDNIIIDNTVYGVTLYPFVSVTGNREIHVNFVPNAPFTITATSGANGTITPGTKTLYYGNDQKYDITPATGYHVADVQVDGSSIGPVTSHTFNNITANHSISATFAINTYTITTSPGSNGTITPVSPTVDYNSSPTFTITPALGYHVKTLTVDGAPLNINVNPESSAAMTHTFSNVAEEHRIDATFAINEYPITVKQGIGTIKVVKQGTETLSPPVVYVPYGESQTFNIYHTNRYKAVGVKINETKYDGDYTSYTFSNVTARQSLEAVFSKLPCSNPPARIEGTESYFTTLQAAYNAAASGATIQTQAEVFPENFTAARDITVTIKGGYTCEYAPGSFADYTILLGAERVTLGTVNLDSFRVCDAATCNIQ
ncbi:hypothetical protein KI809_11290 [Geobacter pelophilus]|uniref:Bacterial repeat domain-containing protein n=1 Tax=Geoanaerobacter pelophilus TaxID=60036 RepID=A0AAW4L8I2_9BACT|nr:hypothetical protein [Geoanaerobacter pelophilus]MBT0664885.1 hypothetical protein [Geoanaerobacter pelophilus]